MQHTFIVFILASCPNVKNFGMREITTSARALSKIGRMVLPDPGDCPILPQHGFYSTAHRAAS